MGGLIRFVVTFGKIAVYVVVIAAVILVTYIVINRVFRFVIDQIGYESVDLLTWAKQKFPKLSKKEKKDEENLIS